MTDKELAKKVVEHLGLKFFGCYWRVPDGDMAECLELADEHDVHEYIFSWPATGMMIEHMEREGWELEVKGGWVLFYKPHLFDRKQTYGVDRQDGYHIAIAKAFVEAKEMINDR